MGATLYPPPVASPTVTTTGLTPGSGVTVNNFMGRKINGVCSFAFDLAVTTKFNAGSTAPYNLADVVIATLPSGYWPARTVTAIYSTGFADGECDVTADGNVTIRTTNTYSIEVGETIRCSGAFVL
ncbi:hypothetical protein ACOB87_37905 [Streptomyces sp. YS-B37]|uniref:hypothetical protein n=1 Tax=Streptomyces sp. YS-B37 TaxID=3407669 RepID=UPI003B50EB2B